MAFKAHKIALRPTATQIGSFHQQCGYARFAFNSALADLDVGVSHAIKHGQRISAANIAMRISGVLPLVPKTGYHCASLTRFATSPTEN